ncbi:MAG: Fe2+-dependent dioxygenase [Limnobacter sp.]|nr:Fe2+-dependent dioxygenase [Limnobacter sp.]
MLLPIKNLLNTEQLAHLHTCLAQAEWADGKATAGSQSAAVKFNEQLPEQSQTARELGQLVLQQLGQHALFLSAALPHTIYPPLFNRYTGGQHFGMHIDNALRAIPGTRQLLRTDLSATLFLSDPASYTGGELVIHTELGVREIKLPAGDLLLYPASTLHQVKPVTHGTRLASFMWIQSMVQDTRYREVLFNLDQSIQQLSASLGNNHTNVVELTGVYHNLLRMQMAS